MIVKAILIFLLIIAGLSLTMQGLVFLVSDFFWGNLLEIVSIFMLMVLFPTYYLVTLILNYRFWKHQDMDILISDLKKKLSTTNPSKKNMELVKKGKEYFLANVNGLHTNFIFAFYRKSKLEVNDINRIISKAKELENKNILIFCTGSVCQETKELIKTSEYKFIVEDYKNAGDFNLKRYFNAPMKKR